jgi:hypothetical protein
MSDDLIEKVARAMWTNALRELDEETAVVMSGDGWEQYIPDARIAVAIAAADLAAERANVENWKRANRRLAVEYAAEREKGAKLREALERAYQYRDKVWPVSVSVAVHAVLKETATASPDDH